MRNFYIICKENIASGIGVIACDVLCSCLFAKQNNLIPIVDMKHYRNQYFKKNRTFKDNAWEYFFTQPNKYSLDHIKEDDNVIIGNFSDSKEVKLFFDTDWIPKKPKEEDIKKRKEKENLREFLNFSETTNDYIKKTHKEIIGDKENILGILIRGTDYTERRTYKENIQPTIKEVIKKIKEYQKKYPEIEYIYLATEDANIYEKMKKEFGDILLDNKQKRYSYKKNDPFLLEVKTDREDNNYYLALEYLSSLYILSKCKYFIGGRNNGTRFAYILQKNWKDFYIWELGRYGKTIKEYLFSYVTHRIGKTDYKIYNILGLRLKFKIKKGD